MSDKTELRAACETAAKEILKPYIGLCETQHVEIAVCDAIERHIAPVLQSARAAVIEECAKLILERIKRDWWPHSDHYEEGVNHVVAIRALKEQP